MCENVNEGENRQEKQRKVLGRRGHEGLCVCVCACVGKGYGRKNKKGNN